MNAFQKISALFQSVAASVAAANVLDKAYADGVGQPDYHQPFTAESNPQMVAMNVAGLYAADTAANVLTMNAVGNADEEVYKESLERIVNNDLDHEERYIVKNLANLAWRAGQPFRDIATKPLNRITRDVNAQFNTLPEDEQDKDLIQIREGARILLEEITR